MCGGVDTSVGLKDSLTDCSVQLKDAHTMRYGRQEFEFSSVVFRCSSTQENSLADLSGWQEDALVIHYEWGEISL